MAVQHPSECYNIASDDGDSDPGTDPDNCKQNMSVDQRLQLIEIENATLRQEKKYWESHIASLRSSLEDKEMIIGNLITRFNISSIESLKLQTTPSHDETYDLEMRRKAAAMAQRLILENIDLRELINELRDENFSLRNEIYEFQDTINRQSLQIEGLKKQIDGNDCGETEDVSDPSMDERYVLMDKMEMTKLNTRVADLQLNGVDLVRKNLVLSQCTSYITKLEEYLNITIVELIPLKLNDHYKRIY
eukprot:1083759_1